MALAGRYATRIVVHDWAGYSAQRNYAAEIASHDWILAIDADERVPPELAAEIQRIMREGSNVGGYRMPRVSYYLGRWIRGTDWYPDYQLRLYDRRVGPLQRQARARVGRAQTRAAGNARARPAALPVPRHLGPRHEHRSLHDARGRGVVRRRSADEPARSRHSPAGGVPAQLRRAARLSRRHRRIPDLHPQLGTTCSSRSSSSGSCNAAFARLVPANAPGASSARRRPKFARTPNVDGRSRAAACLPIPRARCTRPLAVPPAGPPPASPPHRQ